MGVDRRRSVQDGVPGTSNNTRYVHDILAPHPAQTEQEDLLGLIEAWTRTQRYTSVRGNSEVSGLGLIDYRAPLRIATSLTVIALIRKRKICWTSGWLKLSQT